MSWEGPLGRWEGTESERSRGRMVKDKKAEWQMVIGGARSEESRGQEKEIERTDVKECKEQKQVALWTVLRDSSGRKACGIWCWIILPCSSNWMNSGKFLNLRVNI